MTESRIAKNAKCSHSEGREFREHDDGIISVSYTHLDVYKRQTLYRASTGNWVRDHEWQSKKTNNSQDGGFILNDQLNFKSNPLYDTAILLEDALHR